MLEDIVEFFKDLPSIVGRAIKDIFLLVVDLTLWIRNFILGLFKLTFKMIKNLPTILIKIIKFVGVAIIRLPYVLLMIVKKLFIILKRLPMTIISVIKRSVKLLLKIPLLLVSLVKILPKILVKLPIALSKGVVKGGNSLVRGIGRLVMKIINLFIPKTPKQGIFLGLLILGAIIGTGVTLEKIGSIKFDTPPLVEGPGTVFFISIPAVLKNFPWVVDLSTVNPESVSFLFVNKGYGLPVSITVVSTWFIMAVIFFIFWKGTRNLQIIPGKFQAILESLYGAFDGLTGQMMNTWKKKYFSYISALLLFIVTSNIIAFFPIPKFSILKEGIKISPAFRTPTADLNTTVGLAILTTLIFTAVNLQTNGLREYIKGYFGPIFVMAPLNVIGEIAKPVNISLRLFGNMFAGSVITGLLYMATTKFGPLTAVVAPLHLYFDLFSGVVQGFVFTMLTMVYINGSYGDRTYQEELLAS